MKSGKFRWGENLCLIEYSLLLALGGEQICIQAFQQPMGIEKHCSLHGSEWPEDRK